MRNEHSYRDAPLLISDSSPGSRTLTSPSHEVSSIQAAASIKDKDESTHCTRLGEVGPGFAAYGCLGPKLKAEATII